MLARRSYVTILYKGIDITKDIAADLLSFKYEGSASGESDTISLSLKDEKHIWLNQWFPEKGDIIEAYINTLNWRHNNDNQKLFCGKFILDTPKYSGRPSILSMNAISSPLNTSFTNIKKSKAWNKVSLKEIAKDISNKSGLSLSFISNTNPMLEYKEQSEIANSSFLNELCEEYGLAMKVTDGSIIIFDEKEFESKISITTYRESEDVVLSYDFESSLDNTAYEGVSVSYFDYSIGKTIDYLYAPGEVKENKIYKLNKKVSSIAEAETIAKQTYRNLNKKETICNLTVAGNVDIVDAVNVNLEGFGIFSGKYFVYKMSHSVGSGYTTSFTARKVLEGD